MSSVHEFGQALRDRRSAMGLSQARVAALSGLSRQTINQIEKSSIPDLGLNKIERIANTLGLVLHIDTGRRRAKSGAGIFPLARAAISAGVGYRTPITASALKRIFLSGVVGEQQVPHVHALLDEAPVSLLASVVEQLHDEAHVDRKKVWSNFRTLARQVKSKREIWE